MANWQGVAFNQVPDSSNQIHGDDMAQRFGFKGGLVPGVTVSAYLLHPVAEYFGKDFIEHGFAHCRVNAPLYDQDVFDVEITDQGDEHCHTCLKRGEGELLAVAEASIPSVTPDAPMFRGDLLGDGSVNVPATRPDIERLKDNGCYAFAYRWVPEHAMGTYLRDRSLMASLYAEQGFANPSYILGISNWVLAGNIAMNPWVHLETHSQNFAALAAGTDVIGEMSVSDVFERKGHEFVDAEVNIFDAKTLQCYTAIKLRAIYHLRGA